MEVDVDKVRRIIFLYRLNKETYTQIKVTLYFSICKDSVLPKRTRVQF